VVEDEASRKALQQRFLYAQRFAQDDPWAVRAAAKPAEFRPLATVV
jgi:nitrite reductase (NADH) large subunit